MTHRTKGRGKAQSFQAALVQQTPKFKLGKNSNRVLVVVGVEEALTGSDYWEWLSGGTPVAVKTVGSGRHNRPSLNRRPDTQP